ncbi:HET-domain-containing protein [Lophium mytilinum]|uniref:HET-domain-containing protein n=1 Tax=Lophium mytilinum TaxID=390894 RepID=A0A6A6RAF6_9PEZI|nr:HET-domain-containing protein [Lophium mytilinum]
MRFLPSSFNLSSSIKHRVRQISHDTSGSRPRYIGYATIAGVVGTSFIVSVATVSLSIHRTNTNRQKLATATEEQWPVHGHIKSSTGSNLASSGITRSDGSIPFTYDQLRREEKTRLLVLEAGEPEDELRCRLNHVSTLQDSQYEALSYAWGEPSTTHSIYTPEGSVLITASLFGALRRLRLPDRARVIWADQLCINQEDEIERGHQVQFMREIYENATQVIIWLGEESSVDQRAFQSLEIIENSLGLPYPTPATGMGWRRQKSKALSGGTIMGPLANVDSDQLANLLRRQWFRRTWIVQEVASTKKATVMNKIAAIETARRSRNGPLHMPLFQMLLATSYNQCSDPRDKVYAILGLGKDWDRNQDMNPDYTVGMGEVYKRFAIWDSKRNANLRVLSCASGPKEDGESRMPSWTPDWTNIENESPFVRYSDRTGFAASGKMLAMAWHSHDGNTLHAEGKLVDTVRELGSLPTFTPATGVFEINQESISRLQKSKKWLQDCQRLAESVNGPLSNDEYNAFARTMTCSLTGDAFPAPSTYSAYFKEYMRFMDTTPEKYAEYYKEFVSSPKRLMGADERNPYFRGHTFIESSLQQWTSKRRLCTTENRRLAVVPKSARAGDAICVLYGGEVPYVLRPAPDGFYFVVGECYVDDMMHGKALSVQGLRPTRFRLR